MTTGMNAITCLKVNRSRKAANSTTNTSQRQSPKAAGFSIVHFFQICFHIDSSRSRRIPWFGRRVISDASAYEKARTRFAEEPKWQQAVTRGRKFFSGGRDRAVKTAHRRCGIVHRRRCVSSPGTSAFANHPARGGSQNDVQDEEDREAVQLMAQEVVKAEREALRPAPSSRRNLRALPMLSLIDTGSSA